MRERLAWIPCTSPSGSSAPSGSTRSSPPGLLSHPTAGASASGFPALSTRERSRLYRRVTPDRGRALPGGRGDPRPRPFMARSRAREGPALQPRDTPRRVSRRTSRAAAPDRLGPRTPAPRPFSVRRSVIFLTRWMPPAAPHRTPASPCGSDGTGNRAGTARASCAISGGEDRAEDPLAPEALRQILGDREVTAVSDAWDQLLYECIMEGMGYGGNRAPFLSLARSVPLSMLRKYGIGRQADDAGDSLRDRGAPPRCANDTGTLKAGRTCGGCGADGVRFRAASGIRPPDERGMEVLPDAPREFPDRRLAAFCFLRPRCLPATHRARPGLLSALRGDAARARRHFDVCHFPDRFWKRHRYFAEEGEGEGLRWVRRAFRSLS